MQEREADTWDDIHDVVRDPQRLVELLRGGDHLLKHLPGLVVVWRGVDKLLYLQGQTRGDRDDGVGWISWTLRRELSLQQRPIPTPLGVRRGWGPQWATGAALGWLGLQQERLPVSTVPHKCAGYCSKYLPCDNWFHPHSSPMRQYYDCPPFTEEGYSTESLSS